MLQITNQQKWDDSEVVGRWVGINSLAYTRNEKKLIDHHNSLYKTSAMH